MIQCTHSGTTIVNVAGSFYLNSTVVVLECTTEREREREFVRVCVCMCVCVCVGGGGGLHERKC